MTAITDFKNKISNKGHGSGGYCLTLCAMSMSNESTKVNLREASYKLDYSNKLILLELIKTILFPEYEKWDNYEVMAWIKENQPRIYAFGMKDET
jgi:hypothetical protein